MASRIPPARPATRQMSSAAPSAGFPEVRQTRRGHQPPCRNQVVPANRTHPPRRIAPVRRILALRSVTIVSKLYPVATIFRKLATAWRSLRQGGPASVWAAAWRHLSLLRYRRPGNVVAVDGCRISLHGVAPSVRYWLLTGEYELPERSMLPRIDAALPVIELGGSLGVIACLTNRRLKDPSRHLVVEANQALLARIEDNRNRNGARFEAVHAAIAYDTPFVEFPAQEDSLASSLYMASARLARTPALSLEALHARAGFGRFTLICDIEGAETELLEREISFLSRWVDKMILELHPQIESRLSSRRALEIVEAHGFRVLARERDTYCLVNQRPAAAP